MSQTTTQTTFHDRIGRIAKMPDASPLPVAEGPVTPTRVTPPAISARDNAGRSRGWSIFLAVFLGLILVPLSFAARVDTQAVLSPGFGPDVFYYFTALTFTAGFHLLLAGLAIAAMAHRFRRMLLNIVVLEMLIGYGAASLMFATLIP
jgi:hypothetical protein